MVRLYSHSVALASGASRASSAGLLLHQYPSRYITIELRIKYFSISEVQDRAVGLTLSTSYYEISHLARYLFLHICQWIWTAEATVVYCVVLTRYHNLNYCS